MHRNGPEDAAIDDCLSAAQDSLTASNSELQQVQVAYQQQAQQLNAVNQRLAESMEALAKAQRAEHNATNRFAHLQQLNTAQGDQIAESAKASTRIKRVSRPASGDHTHACDQN